MRFFIKNYIRAVCAELVLILLPCMIMWVNTKNGRGLSETLWENEVQIQVENQKLNVETFLIYMISVDYQADMRIEALKALAIAERSSLYAHMEALDLEDLQAKDTEVTGSEDTDLKNSDIETANLQKLNSEKSNSELTDTENVNIIDAEKLGVTYATSGEMAKLLQESDTTVHWSEAYEKIRSAVEATWGQCLVYELKDSDKAVVKQQTDQTDYQEDQQEEESASDTAAETEKNVNDTADMLQTKENQIPASGIVDALWHKLSAGNTRYYAGNLTGTDDGISLYCPELKSMDGKDNEKISAIQIHTVTRRELAEMLWEVDGTQDILQEENPLVDYFTIEERDASGYIESISIGNSRMTGDKAAQLLQLPSSCFFISSLDNGNQIQFTVYGSGSGYGLSIEGANIMAREGAACKEILEYYFPVCQIVEK